MLSFLLSFVATFDLCFIVDTKLEEVKSYLESINIKIEEGIVARTGAIGDIESIYLRDPDMNLIELSNYKKR